jgi:hypothetical protein
MTLNRTHLASAALALALAACSSPKPGTPEFVQKKEDEQQKAAVKAVEQSVAKVPAWVAQPPESPNAWYEIGVESSTDMQMAMDMAMLSAKRSLAFRLAGRVSAMMKNGASQTGTSEDPVVVNEIDRVAKIVATDVNIAGFVREKQEIQQDGKKYKVFVLLRYPLGESNKVIADQVKKSAILDAKVRASKAFQELEQEIEAAKKK